MLRRWLWLMLLLPLLCQAKPTTNAAIDLCPDLRGTWQGTYRDSTHLFPDRDFPIRLNLTYDKGMLYGYTLPANDKKGASYGSKTYYFFANCTHNEITSPYLVAPNKACATAGMSAFITNPHVLQLVLIGSNAMMDWNVTAHLTRVHSVPLREKLIRQVKKFAGQPIASCH